MTRIKDLPTFETIDPTNWVAVDSNEDLEPSGKASPATLAAFVNSDLAPVLSLTEGAGISISGDPQNPTIASTGSGVGDMLSAIYDPQNISNDAFARENHTGEQPISATTGLQEALDDKIDSEDAIRVVENRAELKVTDTARYGMAYLNEDHREGSFKWDSSDLSTMVTADPQEAVYVAPTSDATGASGAWVRQFEGPLLLRWFGLESLGSASNNATALQAAVELHVAMDFTPLHIDQTGFYPFDTEISVTSNYFKLTGVGLRVALAPVGTTNRGIACISSNPDAPLSRVEVKDFRMVGTEGGALSGIYLENVARFILDNVELNSFSSSTDIAFWNEWEEGGVVGNGSLRWFNGYVYQAVSGGGTNGATPPTHLSGDATYDGSITYRYLRPIRAGLFIRYGLYVSLASYVSQLCDSPLVVGVGTTGAKRSTTIVVSNGSRLRSSVFAAILADVSEFDITDGSCEVANSSYGVYITTGRPDLGVSTMLARIGCYFENNGRHATVRTHGTARHKGIDFTGALIGFLDGTGKVGSGSGQYKVEVRGNSEIHFGNNFWLETAPSADLTVGSGSYVYMGRQSIATSLTDVSNINSVSDLVITGSGVIQFSDEARAGVVGNHGDAPTSPSRQSVINHRWDSALTGGRIVTLPTSGIADGHRYRIVRGVGATGGVNLTVVEGSGGPTRAVLDSPGQSAVLEWQGGRYYNLGPDF